MPTNNKCVCDSPYTGDKCDTILPDTQSNNPLKILSLNPNVIKNIENTFTYQLQGKNLISYNLRWDVNTIDDENLFLTGRNEDKLKLAANSLKQGINNITLSLNDTSDSNQIVQYSSYLVVYITSLDPNRFSYTISYWLNGTQIDYGISMDTLVNIEIKDNSINQTSSLRYLQSLQQFTYKFYYEDPFGQKIPLSNDFFNTNTFSTYVPRTQNIGIEIKDYTGQSIYITSPVEIRSNPDYNGNLTDILNVSNPPSKKILDVYNYLDQTTDTLSNDHLNNLTEFLKDSFNSFINDSNSTITDDSVLAVFNQIVINQSTKNGSLHSLYTLNNLISNFTIGVNSIQDPSKVSRDDLKPYYRSLDSLFSAVNNFNATTQNTSNVTSSSILNDVKSSIINLNQYLSRGMDTNERVVVSTKNFDSYIERPSKNQKLVQLEAIDKSNKSFTNYSDYSVNNEPKKDSCGDNTYFCMNEDNFDYFKKYYNYTASTNDSVTGLSIIVLSVNNTQLYNGTNSEYVPITNSSFVAHLYSASSNQTVTNTEYLKYDVVMGVNSNDNSTLNNSACITISSDNTNTYSCLTYYNYTSSPIKTVCRCSGTGEVVNIFSYTISNVAKLFQFPQWSFDFFNPLSMCLVLGSLTIMISLSIILLVFDYCDDKNAISSNKYDDHHIIKNEFRDLTSLCGANMFSFALYMTMYVFPFLSIFTLYNYNQPRFMRFCVELLAILLGMLFSLLPYYKTPFTYQQSIIERRDIEEADLSIDNLPYRLVDVMSTFIYSLFATIVISILLNLFSILMKWRLCMIKIWKNRKCIIEKYIKTYLIRPLYLPEKWKLLRMRILALNRICGSWILKKQKLKENEKDKTNFFYSFFESSFKNSLKTSNIVY